MLVSFLGHYHHLLMQINMNLNKSWQGSSFSSKIFKIPCFLLFRQRTIPEVLACYPEMKAKNDSGKDVMEFGNKYWVMVNNEDADCLYPEKDSRK